MPDLRLVIAQCHKLADLRRRLMSHKCVCAIQMTYGLRFWAITRFLRIFQKQSRIGVELLDGQTSKKQPFLAEILGNNLMSSLIVLVVFVENLQYKLKLDASCMLYIKSYPRVSSQLQYLDIIISV